MLEVGSNDEVNELQESVICEPGQTLQLNSLRLEFGEFAGDTMPVRLDAVCERRGSSVKPETGIKISGTFRSRMKLRRPYAG